MNVQISKYRKVQKPRVSNCKEEKKRLLPIYGAFSIKSALPGRVTFAQINAAKKTIKKVIKKNGVIWQIVFADRPVTSKPAEVRMGKGKGAFSHNVAILLAGTTLFELGGPSLSMKLAYQAFLQANYKLGLPLKFSLRLS